jgi:alkanesulfonate monooxygenase SsuD/methylene tetrahydromethanopterin reductase-like flavin-dependent oxidoreductase (luciferase family)
MIGAEGERLLRLTARHADAWNWAFASSVEEVAPRQAAVDAACREVGRDPATLERSVAVPIDLPGRPDAPPGSEAEVADWVREGTGAATGSPEELAALLHAFAAAGMAEVQVWLAPSTVAGVEAFAPVLALLYRG